MAADGHHGGESKVTNLGGEDLPARESMLQHDALFGRDPEAGDANLPPDFQRRHGYLTRTTGTRQSRELRL